MNEKHMLEIVEQYSRISDSDYGGNKVTRTPDNKTVYGERFGEIAWAVMMTEYKIGGAKYSAGNSSFSQTVYISLAP
jgi:hypothetical protein